MGLRRSILQKLSAKHSREWPSMPATIDIVTVLKQEEEKGRQQVITYLATLTYFYRNPDLQTGEYRRVFEEWERTTAQEWATSFKGSTVQIHVDPLDPTRSVLLDEDLLSLSN